MRKVSVFALMALILSPLIASAGPDDTNYNVLSYGASFKDSVSGVSSITLPSGRPYEAFLQVEGGDIRFTTNGSSNPAGGTGYLMLDGGTLRLSTTNQISKFQWTLNAGETGVTLYYTIYGK